MKKYAPLVVAVIASISTVLTNILSIDAALGRLAGSRLFAYLFVAWDILKLELAIVLIVVLIRRPLAKVITQATKVMIKSVRSERREKMLWRLVCMAAVIAGAIVPIAYQGYYLALGKYSMWAAHDRSLLRRGADSFLRGEHDRAKLLLRVCNTVYRTCDQTEADVNRRLDDASAIRKIEAALPSGSPARPAYAVASYALDRRWDLYQNAIRSLRRDFNRANVLWLKALEQLRDGQSDRTLATLAQLQDVWPGFADSNDLLEKLRDARPAAIADTVRRLGVEQVAKETNAPFEIVSLDSPALSPIQQLQLPYGPQNVTDEYGYERSRSFTRQASRIARGAGFRFDFEDPEPPSESSLPDETEESAEQNERPDPTQVTVAPPADQPIGGIGISRVVIDAGHGGTDRGTQANGITEAELVLDIGLRVEEHLLDQPEIDVVLTRRSDTFIPLNERTAIANREKADLFISIHTNANSDPSVRGVETYVLNFARNPAAESVAARENYRQSQPQEKLPDLVSAIAHYDKLDESRELAANVQASLVSRLRVPKGDLGVKQGPFFVLIGTRMPSVLTEISFLSNKEEAALLNQEAHRQNIAEALGDGLLKYLSSLTRSPRGR